MLVLIHALPRVLTLVLAAAIVLFYFAFGRQVRWDTVRQVSWIGAASQVLMVLVPVLAALIGGLAVIALVALAVVALFVLLNDRR